MITELQNEEAIRKIEAELEQTANALIQIGGMFAVKRLIQMIQRQSMASAGLHRGLAWASGILEGALKFIDKPQY